MFIIFGILIIGMVLGILGTAIYIWASRWHRANVDNGQDEYFVHNHIKKIK